MTINTENDLKLEIEKNLKTVLNGYLTNIEVSAYRDSLITRVVLNELRAWVAERSRAFEASEKFNDAIDAALDFTDEQINLNKVMFKMENKKTR